MFRTTVIVRFKGAAVIFSEGGVCVSGGGGAFDRKQIISELLFHSTLSLFIFNLFFFEGGGRYSK